MIDFLYEAFVAPWTWGAWMWRGVLAAALIAVSASAAGVFLYLRRMSLLTDALSHVALAGVVGAYLVTGSVGAGAMLGGAIVAGVLSSLLIGKLATHPKVRDDAAIGIVFTAVFALAVILLSTVARDVHIDVQCVLFGNVLGISDHSLLLLTLTAPMTLALIFVFFRPLVLSTFDPLHAAAVGVPVVLVSYGLMSMVSVTAAAGFEAVGAILVVAMFIIPAATAHLFARSVRGMIVVSIATAVMSAVLGMYVSVWTNVYSGGAIVVVAGLIYLLAFLFAPEHGRLRSPGPASGLRIHGALP